MTSSELYDLFRQDVQDALQPYLWTDEEVFAYMNDAYYMFVRLTGGISDYTSTATDVAVRANDPYADIDTSILRVRRATISPDDQELNIINAQDVNDLSDTDYGVLRNLNSVSTVGKPRHMIIGTEP